MSLLSAAATMTAISRRRRREGEGVWDILRWGPRNLLQGVPAMPCHAVPEPEPDLSRAGGLVEAR
jgi:hypothetical protein